VTLLSLFIGTPDRLMQRCQKRDQNHDIDCEWKPVSTVSKKRKYRNFNQQNAITRLKSEVNFS